MNLMGASTLFSKNIAGKSQNLLDGRSEPCASRLVFLFPGIHSCAMASPKTNVNEVERFGVQVDYKRGE